MQNTVTDHSEQAHKTHGHHDWRSEVGDIEGQMLALLTRLQDLSASRPGNLNLEESIMFQQRALSCLSAATEHDDEKDWLEEIDWKSFGLRLVQRRDAANMHQKELAGLVGVTAQTIRNIESAAKRPSRELLFRLLSIPELNLRVSDITGEENRPTLIPTSWLAPQYDPHKMLTDLIAKLNGTGDALEQTTAYLDSRSAADWLSISLSPNFLALTSNHIPLIEAAQIVTKNLGRGVLEVCALGSGDGRKETAFTQFCAEQISNPSHLRLYLLDISHTLLMEGYNHAKQSLSKRGVQVLTMHGNFHDLSRYPILEKKNKKGGCVRVLTMLGNTLANLDNEVRFFRDTLSGCVSGDYFLADFTVAHASADDPDEIRRKDPVLRTPIPAARANWLGGPLRRYCKEVRDVEVSVELDTHCTVRGSYEMLYVATASMVGGKPERRFVMFRTRLYDPPKLMDCLASLGWQCESLIPYAHNELNKVMLMLLRKQ